MFNLYESRIPTRKRLHYEDVDYSSFQDGYWVPLPNRKNDKFIFDVRSMGQNNTHYIMPVNIHPVLIGRFHEKGKFSWDKVETWVKNTFTTENSKIIMTSNELTRNIDFQRIFQYGGKTCSQSIEVKKTSGCHTNPPSLIISSKKQLEALLTFKNNQSETQLVPSVYMIVSVDYDWKHNKTMLTCWCIPVLNKDHFTYMNTSEVDLGAHRFQHNLKKIKLR